MIRKETIENLRQLASPLITNGIITVKEWQEIEILLSLDRDQMKLEHTLKLFTREEVANILVTTSKTIDCFIKEGKLEKKKFSKKMVRIPLDSLLKFIKES